MVTSPTRVWEEDNNFAFIALNYWPSRLEHSGSRQLGDWPIDHHLEVGLR